MVALNRTPGDEACQRRRRLGTPSSHALHTPVAFSHPPLYPEVVVTDQPRLLLAIIYHSPNPPILATNSPTSPRCKTYSGDKQTWKLYHLSLLTLR